MIDIKNNEEHESLRKKDIHFSDYAAEHGVGEAFKKFCAPEVIHISAQGYPTVGRNQVVQNMKSFELTYTMSWRPQIVQINPDHITGLTKGAYKLFKLTANQPSVKIGEGQYLTVWKKSLSGEWKAIYDMDGSIFQN